MRFDMINAIFVSIETKGCWIVKKEHIIVIVLMFIAITVLSSCSLNNDNQTLYNNSANSKEAESSDSVQVSDELSGNADSSTETVAELLKVDNFIEQYNMIASTPITDIIEIDITDKESGHYRTEFRLGAFSDSYAKTGKIGDTTIDIVGYGWNNDNLRLYVDSADLALIKEIIEAASPILDPMVSEADVQAALEYLDEHQEANGYYYGDIGMTLLGKNKACYELMLKVE